MGVKVREKVKGSNVWWVFVNHAGQRTSRRIGRQKSAEEAAGKIEAALKLGQSALKERKEPSPTLADYWSRFESTYLRSAVAESTAASYRKNFRTHILPAFGSKRLDAISAMDMEVFVGDLVSGKKLAKATIETILRQLSRLYNRARKHKLVTENPATGLRELYSQAATRHEEVEPLSHEEVPLFLQAVQELIPEHYALFLCAIHTGMRAGEIAGIQWGDIDLNQRIATIRRSIDRVHRKVVPTKNKRVRRIDLSDELLEALAVHRRRQKTEWFRRGSNVAPEWVFANSDGNWRDMSNLSNRQFYRCLERAGLRRIRFHDLRHTFASLLIQNGESLAYVKDQVGHRSIKMTVDVYGHLVPGANRQAVNRLPGLADRKVNSKTG